MSDEGKTYTCSWKRTPTGGYQVWVVRRRPLSAEGATFAEADRKLWEVIGIATGDAESLRQYSPPEPAEVETLPGELGRLRELGGYARCWAKNPEALFEGGLCVHCLMPLGRRTDAGLRADSVESGAQAAYATLPRVPTGSGPKLTMVTEDFLKLLTKDERAMFEWRPVELSRRGRRMFYELVPRFAPISDVGIKGRKAYYGRCEICGATWVVPEWMKGAPNGFVSANDVPNPMPSLIAVGRASAPNLAVSETRWAELAGLPGMKGVDSSVIAIVDESVVERAPTYTPRPMEKRPDEAAQTWFK